MKTNPHSSAFTMISHNYKNSEGKFMSVVGEDGLTKREYFAAMVFQGMISNPKIMENMFINDELLFIVRACMHGADALIEALNEPKEETNSSGVKSD